MEKEFKDKAILLLMRHEGYNNKPYIDTVGKITIGIGYNLSDRGLPDSVIKELFLSDLDYFYNNLFNYKWFRGLDDARRLVILDMAFNLGLKGLLSFCKMIDFLTDRNYIKAAEEMENSKWAVQVKSRAVGLAKIMRTGEM